MTEPPLSIHAWLRYDAIDALLANSRSLNVLEIGSGLGSVGALLARSHEYIGIDRDEQAVDGARALFKAQGLDSRQIVLGGLEKVSGRTFDLVCAFEVLEHFEDDHATVTEWRRFVAPDGLLLFSVPANPDRFGKADLKAGHFRRYRRADIESLLASTGFETVRMLNYGFPVGYLLETVRNVAARRHLRRQLTYEARTLASGRWLQPSQRLARVTRGIAKPLALAQRPFMASERGTGLVVLARRS